jgi:hypothetical protein
MPDSDFPFGSGRGIPKFTDHEIAAAIGLTKLPEGTRDLMRIKYSDQRKLAGSCANWLYLAIEPKEMDSWIQTKSHRPGFIKDMTLFVVYQYAIPHVCPVCNGTKERVIENKVIQCWPCNGTGVPTWTIRTWASLLEVPKTTFDRIWDDRRKLLIDILAKWDDMGWRAIGKRMFG